MSSGSFGGCCHQAPSSGVQGGKLWGYRNWFAIESVHFHGCQGSPVLSKWDDIITLVLLCFLAFVISGLGNNRRQLASPYGKQDSSLVRSNREKQVPLQMGSIFTRMVPSYIHQLVCTWTPIPVRKPGSNIEKLKKLVSMIYQDFPRGFQKTRFYLWVKSHVPPCLGSNCKGARDQEKNQIDSKTLLEGAMGYGGQHSSHFPSGRQFAIIK